MAVHALGFTWCNMLHMTNWLVNGMPERFPKLKTVWIESGLAWVPFLMQRLDNEFMMRTSDAPLLKRKPSEYMREMFYTTQPMEMVDNREALEAHLQDDQRRDAAAATRPTIRIGTWTCRRRSTICRSSTEQAKRNILGGNAQRLFNLDRCCRRRSWRARPIRACPMPAPKSTGCSTPRRRNDIGTSPQGFKQNAFVTSVMAGLDPAIPTRDATVLT